MSRVQECVAVKSCPSLMELINHLQQPLPLDVALLIKESFFCGYSAGQTSVKCDTKCLCFPRPDHDVLPRLRLPGEARVIA